MEKVSLKKNQEIKSIELEKAENGGFSVCFTIVTNGKTHMETAWDEKEYVFSKEQEQEAIDFTVELLKTKMNQ